MPCPVCGETVVFNFAYKCGYMKSPNKKQDCLNEQFFLPDYGITQILINGSLKIMDNLKDSNPVLDKKTLDKIHTKILKCIENPKIADKMIDSCIFTYVFENSIYYFTLLLDNADNLKALKMPYFLSIRCGSFLLTCLYIEKYLNEQYLLINHFNAIDINAWIRCKIKT